MFFYSENFLLKEGISSFFHSSQTFTGNSHRIWVYLLLPEGRIVPSCKLNVKLGPPRSLYFGLVFLWFSVVFFGLYGEIFDDFVL